MDNALLIGIDVGTTSVKTVVFDSQGTIMSQAGQEYPTVYPHPNWAQQDMICSMLDQQSFPNPTSSMLG